MVKKYVQHVKAAKEKANAASCFVVSEQGLELHVWHKMAMMIVHKKDSKMS